MSHPYIQLLHNQDLTSWKDKLMSSRDLCTYCYQSSEDQNACRESMYIPLHSSGTFPKGMFNWRFTPVLKISEPVWWGWGQGEIATLLKNCDNQTPTVNLKLDNLNLKEANGWWAWMNGSLHKPNQTWRIEHQLHFCDNIQRHPMTLWKACTDPHW